MAAVSATITGIQEAQRALLAAAANVRGPGLDRAVFDMAAATHRYMVSITHVDTGALRGAEYVRKVSQAHYEVAILSGAKNPVSGVPVVDYAGLEEGRGGDHAFASRTIKEGGDRIQEIGAKSLARSLF